MKIWVLILFKGEFLLHIIISQIQSTYLEFLSNSKLIVTN